MSRNPSLLSDRLAGHDLRNATLRKRSVARANEAPPLARALVLLRAQALGMTRLEFSRESKISRSALRDMELGIHTPTRRILQQFMDYCEKRGIPAAQIEEIRSLYAGADDKLGSLIARFELRAGSAVELARRTGISPSTLWEYRRGNFPLPLAILRRLCKAVGENCKRAEAVWFESERQRFIKRGYPEALAEFWSLCARGEYAEKHLPALGLGTAAMRRLRYLELPEWEEVAAVAGGLCRDERELRNLEQLWRMGEREQKSPLPDPFGSLLQELRRKKGVNRREIADLFGIGGKKPARVIQSIEEKGCYSAQAYPAGLAALLGTDVDEHSRLLGMWEERRQQFHRRHRPEMRIDLRLARERYGFDQKDMESILGYSSLEYQRIERGAGPLTDTARDRILAAIHTAGKKRVEEMLQAKSARDTKRVAWRSPSSVKALVRLLAVREGGIIPLLRCLRAAGESGYWTGRLRNIASGIEVPAWPIVQRIGQACGVPDLEKVCLDWREQYRTHLQLSGCSPLGTEVRLVIAEVAPTLIEFSKRLGFSPSVLVRDLQRMDSGRSMKWFHVERILTAAALPEDDSRWHRIYAWWYAAADERVRA